MIYEFAATQDLHGWGKPWAPGANVNLWYLYRNGYYSASGIFTPSDMTGASPEMEVTPGDVYTFSLRNIGTGNAHLRMLSFKDDHTQIENSRVNGLNTMTYTVPEDAAYMAAWYNVDGHTEKVTQEYSDAMGVQLQLGSTATDFSPYSNICPPEGYKIWDPSADDFTTVYAGYVNTNTRELYLRPVYEEYAGEELVGPWMSSLDEYSEDATPTEGAFVIDFGGELTSYEITPFMLQTLLDSLGIRQHFTNGAGLLNSLMDQAQGRVRSEEELLHLSRPLKVIAIGDQLPAGITFKPISKDVLPGLPGKFIR